MKIPISNAYPYKKLERLNIDGTRYYETPMGLAPSVTTILSATLSDKKTKSLQNWISHVGESRANQIKNEAANVGTALHLLLEEYCSGYDAECKTNLVYKIAYPMAQSIIDQGIIPHISLIYGNEVAVHYENLYAGTSDLIGMWDGNLAIIDYKQSNKDKTDDCDAVSDYKCQLAAYALAHNKMFGTNINAGVILMSTRACKYLEFKLNECEFDMVANQWLDRVEQYYNQIL